MQSILKIIDTNDIKQIDKSDIDDAFLYLKNWTKSHKNLSENVKKIVICVLWLCKEFNISKNKINIKGKILYNLNDSNKLEYVWIWKLVTELLTEDKCVLCMDHFLKLASYKDTKTWLPNEYQFHEDIEKIEKDKIIAILKINNYKYINSHFGYKWWDEILLNVKNEFIKVFWELWFNIYKISQLNFWLLKESPNSNIEIENIINKIEEKIEKLSVNTKYWTISIKSSVWISFWDNANYDNSISALYSSNDSWKLTIYNKKLEKKLQKESWDIIKWSKYIKEWLEKNYFIPYYQWIRNNKTWKINKYEALIRYKEWDKVISPWEFLWIARELNYLWEISKKLIETVISEMREHNYDISINLTEEDFLNDKLINLITNNLDFYWVDPKRLTVEVLEDITWELNNKIIKNINKLKYLGIQISIDDFWTGNSNFARLTEISPDYLKIDWSLVKWLIWNKPNKYADILRAIIDFWHLHNAKIVAEYVENEEIDKIVNLLWIDYSQWYHYSKPSRDIFNNTEK